MSDYPEFREFLTGFTDRYTLKTEVGAVVSVTAEELQVLSKFIVKGIADWIVVTGSNEAGNNPPIGEFLDDYADQYTRRSEVGMVVQVTEEEMMGLGLFLVRGLVGWILRLDQNRGRFKKYDKCAANEGLSISSL